MLLGNYITNRTRSLTRFDIRGYDPPYYFSKTMTRKPDITRVLQGHPTGSWQACWRFRVSSVSCVLWATLRYRRQEYHLFYYFFVSPRFV